MTKQEILRKLEQTSRTKGFITATQFAEFMSIKSADYATKRFLSELECIDGKYYFIPDIAAHLKSLACLKEEII